MIELPRIAQAQALEIAVVISGATTAHGTDKRELFSENATTILVFQDGAVLHLRSKVAVGQAIFVHNQQNGREILCKVLEAPADGSAGHTHLEFTEPAAGFWDSGSAQSVAAGKLAQPQTPSEDNLAMMSETVSGIDQKSMTIPGKESDGPLHEDLVPAHEMVPESASAPNTPVPDFEPAATTGIVSTVPTGEQIDAALRQLSVLPPSASPAGTEAASALPTDDPELDRVQNERHLAAMMAREARFAKFAASKIKKSAEIAKDPASLNRLEPAPGGEAVCPQEAFVAKASWMETLATGRNATILQVGTAVVILVSLYFIWNAMKGVFVHSNDQVAVSTVPKQKAIVPAPTKAATAYTVAAGAIPTPSSVPANATAARAVAASGSLTRKVSPTTATSIHALTASASRPNRSAARSLQASDPESGANRTDRNSVSMVPAKILSQPQPTLPYWAESLGFDGVVTLDAVIDERGAVVESNVLSGPRPLQHEAQRAVGLWQFEPAQSGGQPVASHMKLSVEFLPPPAPKRHP